ncbi:alcohol dehydrogenase catalytic domain-containing protein [Paraburkholderia phenoliruptrix]|uniref:alcohol dehydrogenase catalytic domain-containing protein n=1 Tax=Paraburkholderia phenoliruptrix TaxID=252970 RepID=UPI001C6EB8DC|nr:zinc-binding dehydrogenase [Paraburkholderia phenoliruptrix]MBW9107421.1 alcohol dehydrogenase catalytic domain-containing protein [Paraburkholderia phenoliruptrix]MBW9128157.1 alcohol dehydrogenase catalytic domain-containing protein [Paraburkholderia ginsengiterrae]
MSRVMRAAILEGAGQPLRIVHDAEIDDPRAGEVLVRITHCGVCNTDLALADGKVGYPVPAVLGHEAAGTVAALGAGVTDLVEGQRVVVSMRPACGTCYFCVRNQPVLCIAAESPSRTAGPTGDDVRVRYRGVPVARGLRLGAFAEYVLVERSGVVLIPDSISSAHAATMGCAVQTGMGSVANVAAVPEGATAAVVGLGAVGLSTIQALRIAKAALVVGLDFNADRRGHAQKLGAHATFDSSAEGFQEPCRALTGGMGFDFVFDGVCSPDTLKLSAALVRKGGAIVMIGVAKPTEPVAIGALDVVLRQLQIKGSYLGNCHAQRDLPRYFDLCCQQALNLSSLVTKIRPLEEVNEALQDLRDGVGIRTVLTI